MNDKMPELPTPPEKKPGLFAPKAPPGPVGPSPELQHKLNTIAARLRISEERYTELRKKLLMIERNMLLHNKKLLAETKTLNSETSELRHMVHQLEDRFRLWSARSQRRDHEVRGRQSAGRQAF